MSNVQVVLCSFPDLPKARHIGTLMIEKQLVACVNLIPEVESLFRWEGKITAEKEVLGIFKTTSERLLALEKELGALHPYDIHEFLVLPVDSGSKAYLNWVRSATQS